MKFFLLEILACSEDITESYLPTSDCMDPYVMELKRIPRCSDLVLGHNGFGLFCLWYAASLCYIFIFICQSNIWSSAPFNFYLSSLHKSHQSETGSISKKIQQFYIFDSLWGSFTRKLFLQFQVAIITVVCLVSVFSTCNETSSTLKPLLILSLDSFCPSCIY